VGITEEEITALIGPVVLAGVLEIRDARSVRTAELSALQQIAEQSPGTAINRQGISLVTPDGHIVRVDVQTVVILYAGVKTFMLQTLMSAAQEEIAVELVIQMDTAVVPAILYRDVYALTITAESVRAMEMNVLVIKKLSTATEPVFW
jgi:hypothetical protein